MKIDILEETKNVSDIGKSLFNKEEQLEVTNLQEQMKNYLESDKKIVNKEITKDKDKENQQVKAVIEIKQTRDETKEKKNNFVKNIFNFVGEMAKSAIMTKLIGKANKYLGPVIINLKNKILDFKDRKLKQ